MDVFDDGMWSNQGWDPCYLAELFHEDFDDGMWSNQGWDPCYLAELFHEDFNDMSDL